MISSAERPFAAVIALLAAAATFLDAQAILHVDTSHVVREAAATLVPPHRETLGPALQPPNSHSTSTKPVPDRCPSDSPAPTDPPQVSMVGASTRTDRGMRRAIHKVGPNEYTVQRAALDSLLEAQAEARGLARLVPEQETGKTVGIRLYGIGSDTLLGMLGFQNGDRLQRINFYDITSPDQALEAYAHLRTANLLLVEVNRKGVDTYLLYRIV